MFCRFGFALMLILCEIYAKTAKNKRFFNNYLSQIKNMLTFAANRTYLIIKKHTCL